MKSVCPMIKEWHLKQLSDNNGRISRVKSTFPHAKEEKHRLQAA